MRRHSTATLMGLTKRELVEYVRMAEHNQEVAEETLNQQAENVKDWMPVVHGRWIDDGWGSYIKRCSVCRSVPLREVGGRNDACYSNYCPHCGAKMDGDGNG